MRASGNGLGQATLDDLTSHLFAFVCLILTQLTMDRPQLLLQEELALVLE
jgi:hypothetical protein